MIVLVQRVTEASVRVNDKVVGAVVRVARIDLWGTRRHARNNREVGT